MTEFLMGGPKIKTIVEIWYGDLATLFVEHLGLVEKHYDLDQHKEVGDFSILTDVTDEPHNGYVHTYDPSMGADNDIEEHIDKLIEMGVLPSGHEIYIDCWW